MTTPQIQTLTDELLGEIEAAAGNATQDDWELIPGTKLSGPEVVANGEPIAWVLNSEADSVHIQMANPAMVLALITELRTLRAQVKALQSDANSWQSGYDEGRRMAGKHRLSEIEQLRAENAELRKDAGRWRYIRDLIHPLDIVDFQEARDSFGMRPTENISAQCDTAIDTAMEQSK
jgi:hypothetical protein